MRLLVLGVIQGALGLQHAEQGLGAGGITLLGKIEGDMRLAYFLVLPLALVVHTLDGIECLLHVGKARQNARPVVFQQFLLLGRGQVAGRAQAAVVEDRRDQPAGEGVIGAVQDLGEGACAAAQVGAQSQLGQQRGSGDLNVGAGCRQACLGSGDIRAAAEQIAGDAAADARPLQGADRATVGGQALDRLAQQGGQGDAAVLPLLLKQRHLAFLGSYQAALLGQFQTRGRT